MTANRVIYLLNQNPELLKTWRELDECQKRILIRECERAEECDIEKIIGEISDGQRRLF